MAVVLKEKVKKYIKANYGNCTVAEVAEKFGVSQTSVEEYIIDELPFEEDAQPAVTPSPQNRGPKWRNRVLIVLILIAIVSLIVGLTVSELSNNDIWHHLKNGQMILKTHRFQYTDPYSCNMAGKPWINEAWFAGIIFYIIYYFSGVNGLIFLKTFLILLMTTLILITCYRINIKFVLFVPLAVFMLFNVGVRFLMRTEMFGYIFIAAYFLVLFQYKYRRTNWRTLLFLPVLQIFWSNMHGSFIVGIFIIGAFIGGETMRLLINRYLTSRQKDLLSWKRLKPVYTIFFITLFACLLNPYGFRLFIQPFYVVIHKSEYIKTIYEWQSPFESSTFMSSYAFIYYIIWMCLLGISFLLDIKRIDITNLIFALFFGYLAATMHRQITFFTIATCPIMGLNFQQAGEDFLKISNQKLKQSLDAGFMVIILAILVPLILISFKYGYIYRKNSSKPFGLGVASNMPIKATEYIKANHIKGCCFNSYTFGTYLIFHCFPDVRVTMDSRAEHVYGEDFYKRHQAALYNVDIFRQILEEFNIEFILLKYETGELANHCEYLNKSGQWALVYFDEICFLYVRRLPEYADLIARDEYKYLHPLLTLQRQQVAKTEIDGYIRECNRNYRMNPDSILPNLILLNLYSVQGIWDKAIEHGKIVIEKNPGNFSALMIMGTAYKATGEIDKAKDMYQRAFAIKPDSQEVMKALMQLGAQSKE